MRVGQWCSDYQFDPPWKTFCRGVGFAKPARICTGENVRGSRGRQAIVGRGKHADARRGFGGIPGTGEGAGDFPDRADSGSPRRSFRCGGSAGGSGTTRASPSIRPPPRWCPKRPGRVPFGPRRRIWKTRGFRGHRGSAPSRRPWSRMAGRGGPSRTGGVALVCGVGAGPAGSALPAKSKTQITGRGRRADPVPDRRGTGAGPLPRRLSGTAPPIRSAGSDGPCAPSHQPLPLRAGTAAPLGLLSP